jgi:hypothetical protein
LEENKRRRENLTMHKLTHLYNSFSQWNVHKINFLMKDIYRNRVPQMVLQWVDGARTVDLCTKEEGGVGSTMKEGEREESGRE